MNSIAALILSGIATQTNLPASEIPLASVTCFSPVERSCAYGDYLVTEQRFAEFVTNEEVELLYSYREGKRNVIFFIPRHTFDSRIDSYNASNLLQRRY